MRTSQLARIYETTGPYASVTLDVGHTTEKGAREHELRVRAAAEELASLGAPDDIVRAATERLEERVDEPAPVARVVVATPETVVFDELVHRQIDQPAISFGPLPDVAAWIEEQDRNIPFVLALVDHTGGSVSTYHSEIPGVIDERVVGGETEHVHLYPEGGWATLKYQHETENVWQRNADAVAEEIESRARAGQRLVILAGDPKSRADVMKRLADLPAEVAQLESGGRAADGGDEALRQAIREVLLQYAIARRLELAHTLKDRMGQDKAVATGVDDVAEAFVRGQVDTLLLDPDEAARHRVLLAEHPGLRLGSAPEDEPLRADQALIAAAALTDAEIAVSPSDTIGGTPAAALLRW
jgi:hypothetical protein